MSINKILVTLVIVSLMVNVPAIIGSQAVKAQIGDYSVTLSPTIIKLVGKSENFATTHPKGVPSGHHAIPFHSKDDKALSFLKQQMRLKTPQTTSPLAVTTSAQLSSSTGFDGLNSVQSGGYYPPDVQVATGPNNVLEMVNLEGEIFSKTGTSVKFFDLSSFFTVPSSDFISDPKVLYDSISQRWVASITDVSINSVLLAVSTSSDPTVSWKVYQAYFGHCADQPILGINDNKVVVSANDFTNYCGVFGGGYSFAGAQFVIIDKSGLVSGLPSVSGQSFGPNNKQFSIHPVQSLSATAAPNYPLYMVSVGYGNTNQVKFFTINGAVPNASVTLTSLPINSVGIPPDAKQLGTSTLLATGDARVQDAKWFTGNLWFAFTDACTPSGDNTVRSCIHLTEISTNTPSVTQDFFDGANGFYYFYPALAQDGSGNLDLIYGFSSSNTYPSLAVTGQAATGPAGTLQQPLTIKLGQTYDGSNRYGDYFGAGVDPSNPSLVWVGGEYHSSSLPSPNIDWATFIASMTATSVLLDVTTTTITPNTPSVTAGSSIQFSAAVADTTSSSNTPTGTVTWSDGGKGGTFSPGGSCSLSSGSCTITYAAPSTAGSVTITGTYSGDSTHYTSSGSSSLTVNPSSPSKLAFITAPQTLTAGTVSGVITVQQQDLFNNPVNAGTGGVTVNLSTTSSGGQFSASSTFTTTTTTVTIPAGSSSASFFYKDTSAGTPTITASAGVLASATQTETIVAAPPPESD